MSLFEVCKWYIIWDYLLPNALTPQWFYVQTQSDLESQVQC